MRLFATLAALAVLAASPAVPAEVPAEVPASSGQAGQVPASSGQAAETVERRLTLMGTEAGVVVTADDRASALAASEAAVRALEDAERRLSTWTEESELARLNAAPVGRPVALSPELHRELAAAEACRRVTDGAFAAGVGPLVDAWGLRTGGRQPEPEALRAALAASTGEVIALGGGGTATRRRAGSRIEEGGFGKGAALDAAREALAAHPAVRSARIDLGGQVLFVGPPGIGAAAELAVAHPEHRERPVLALAPEALAGRSAATSGNSERGIVVDGRRLSHLLDPRTGHPAADVGSVTVLARSALTADCLSTGLYVLAARDGVDAALAVAEEAGADAAFVQPIGSGGEGGDLQDRAAYDALRDRVAYGGLQVVATPGLAGRLRVLDPVAVRTVRTDESPAEVAGMEWNEAGAGVAEALEADRAIPRSD